MIAEEDRISNLPDDIIHRILSFLDLKYAMQTSTLSKKWKHVWTLLPQLNLDSRMFNNTSQFDKFVKHALFHRNSCREVTSLELRCKGAATQFTAKSIVNYACLHNVRRLSMAWSQTKHLKFPEFLFSCRALTDLTLAVHGSICFDEMYIIPESAWDFPALETLNLSNFRLSDGKKMSISLFSKCVKLKDLTLHQFDMYGLEELNICAPQLSNLTITSSFYYPKVFNVFAPQLQNLTASVDCVLGLHRCDLLQKSADGFDSLERVNLSWSSIVVHRLKTETHLPQLLSVFQKLYSAKFLILDPFIIQVLSSCLDQLLVEPCPFNYLKCFKMNTMLPTTNGWSVTIPERVAVPVQLKNYFLDKSPSATFITDYPQVPRKRSCEKVHNDAKAKKMAKLDVEAHQPDTIIAGEERLVEPIIQMQDQVITKQKAMFEAKVQMQDQAITNQKAMFEAKIQMQDQIITKQKTMFEAKIQIQDQVIIKDKAKIQMQEQVITKQKAVFEAKIQLQDQVIIKHKAKTQMQDQVITKQKAMFEAQIQMQDDIIADQKAEIQMLEAAKLQHEKLMSYVINCNIAKLKVQVESGNPDYEVIHSIGCEIKSVMELIPERLRVVMIALFSFQYVELKSLFLTRIDGSQWAKIDTELGIINGL